jgi:hypothetical protein
MRRKTFDALLTTAGLVLAFVLLIAGGLLTWGSGFVHTQVHDQLVSQHINFPPAGSEGLSAKDFPTLQQYGGKQVVDGVMAKAYADEYIAVHIKAIGGGKTYSELSTIARTNPNDAAAKAAVDTVFRGETLRGLLLNAYAFDTMGTVAGYASIVVYAGAAALFALALMGFAHLRRTPDEALVGAPVKEPVAV